MINLEESLQRNLERKNNIFFPSTLNHLRDHNGFRPGELHMLVGVKGGGKSSLFRSWIAEALFNFKRVYLRLSEEKAQDYQDEIIENLARASFKVDGMDNLKTDSELDLRYDEHGNQYFDDLRINLRNFAADILFFDNFTTSELTDCNIQIQGKNAKALRNLAQKLRIPVIVATHTSKGFKGTSIASGDDSRGNMTLANTAAYIYSINVIFDHPKKPTILYVDKARHHSNSNKALYELNFNAKTGLFVGDEKTSRSQVTNYLKDAKKNGIA